MSSLLKIEVKPLLSMTQAEAVEALGGLDRLHHLEEHHGLRPWRASKTRRDYSVASIQAAMDRAEQETTLTARARKNQAPGTANEEPGKARQSTAEA